MIALLSQPISAFTWGDCGAPCRETKMRSSHLGGVYQATAR